MGMFLIIVCLFANAFFILNANQPGYKYSPKYLPNNTPTTNTNAAPVATETAIDAKVFTAIVAAVNSTLTTNNINEAVVTAVNTALNATFNTTPPLPPVTNTPIIDGITLNSPVFESIVYTYQVSLGQGAGPPDEAKYSWMIWIVWILASFLTSITFLNMIIAIMAQTFGKVMDQAERYNRISRTNLFADFIHTVNLD